MKYNQVFSGQADTYKKYRPHYPAEMFRFILAHTKQKLTAWDCATGSGQAAAHLAGYFEKVFASDINAEQLQKAIQKTNITYSQFPAEKTAYPNRIFDLITVAQAIHWFDFDAFYKEVKRVAIPGATLAVFGYGRFRSGTSLNPIIDRLYDIAFSHYYSEPREYVRLRYQTIPFPFEEIETPPFLIRVQWTVEQLEGYFNSWSAIRAFHKERGYNPADETIDQIRALVNHDIIEGEFPVFMRLGRIE